jgi:hypothetical protein
MANDDHKEKLSLYDLFIALGYCIAVIIKRKSFARVFFLKES